MIIPKIIIEVQQDDNKSCALACIAMLTGRELNVVRHAVEASLGITPPLSPLDLMKSLAFFHLLPIPVPLTNNGLEIGKIYIVSVPSLNTKNRLHNIIMDCRINMLAICCDPQYQVWGKLYYDFSTASNVFSDAIEIIDPTVGRTS